MLPHSKVALDFLRKHNFHLFRFCLPLMLVYGIFPTVSPHTLQEATMYSGMTRNEVRGILALVLVAALGVGARTYLSDSPRSGVWVERPLKQSSVLHATPTPAPIAVASPTPVSAVSPSPVAPAAQIVASPVPTCTPFPTPQSSVNLDTSQTVVIAPCPTRSRW